MNPDYGRRHDGSRNTVTPGAVYGFPMGYAAHLVSWWTLIRDNYPITGIEYAHRAHAFAFDVDGPVIDSATYAEVIQDARRLAETWRPGCPAVRDLPFEVSIREGAGRLPGWIRSLEEQGPMASDMQAKYLLWVTESLVNDMLPTEDVDDSGFRGHPDKPSLWRAVFSSLGYSAMVDRHAFLTGDIGQQVAVFRPDLIRDIVHLQNPVAACNRAVPEADDQVATGPRP